jgi:hypothetical protein
MMGQGKPSPYGKPGTAMPQDELPSWGSAIPGKDGHATRRIAELGLGDPRKGRPCHNTAELGLGDPRKSRRILYFFWDTLATARLYDRSSVGMAYAADACFFS